MNNSKLPWCFFCVNTIHSLPPSATLVQILNQLGFDLTSDIEITKAVLARFNITEATSVTDDQNLEIFSALAGLASEGSALCDIGALVRALSNIVSRVFSGSRFNSDNLAEPSPFLGIRHHYV